MASFGLSLGFGVGARSTKVLALATSKMVLQFKLDVTVQFVCPYTFVWPMHMCLCLSLPDH